MAANTVNDKIKKLKHVKVYDRLFEQIKNGTFPPESRLPSEPELAEQMGVSRMTLRKALALLQEDDLIKNVHGIGNFVKQLQNDSFVPGMELMQHPVYRCCTEPLNKVEMEFRIEPPTDAISQTLQRVSPAVVLADRWYKHDELPCAYSLSFIPIELISEEKLDLNYPDTLLEYLEKTVYEKAVRCRYTFSHSTSGNFTATRYTLSQNQSFLLIQENLFGKNQQMLLSTKHYIPIALFKFDINLTK